MLNILIILDPLPKLDPEWDNSLAAGAELIQRGHGVWTADVPDLWTEDSRVFVQARRLIYKPARPLRSRFQSGPTRIWDLDKLDLVLLRKEPPVDFRYLYMLHLLELVSKRVRFMNHPRGLRNANEKLWALKFPHWVPPALVTANEKTVWAFQKRHGQTVVKPLDQKGGKDVFILKPVLRGRLRKMLAGGKNFVMAQKRLVPKKGAGEKRIVLLNGKLLAAYEKRPAGKEFRANLGLGATFHACRLSTNEKKLVREMRPYLLKEGLLFAGLDVLNEKLIEVNVTCPAGITEAQFLHPRARPVSAWADFLERFASS